jgi:diguanylate cyclase (GGDEF)-like protein
MKWIFIGILVAVALLLITCNALGKKRELASEAGKSVRALLTSAGVAVIIHIAAMLIPSGWGSALGYGVYNICIDLMVSFLLSYAQHYTGIFEKEKLGLIFNGIIIAVDAVLMIVNVFVPIMFTTEQIDDGSGNLYFCISQRMPLYSYHVIFIYAAVALTIMVFVMKARKTPRIYRVKYLTVIVTLVCAIGVHIAYMFTDLALDYSLLIYALIAVSVFYFTLFFVPAGLMESLLAYVVVNMKDGIMCIDIEGRCVYSNQLIKDLFQTEEEINSFYSDFTSIKGRNLNAEFSWHENRTIDGETHYFANNYRLLYDSKNTCIGCFFVFHDNTDEVQKLDAERYKATHDKLTGIYNREYFFEKAAEKMKSNPDRLYQIVCTDVKDFKMINDIFGVDAGDEVLIKIAKELSTSSRYSVYGRLSGDRFAICMPQDAFVPEVFINGAEKISYISDNMVFHAHIHIGVYKIAKGEDTRVEIMCDRANLAIKTIKNSYQDIIAYYDDDLRNETILEQELITDFDEALETGQFKMYIQPQTSSVTGEVLGGEALVRWLHPKRGLIPPGMFIELFERTGLISRLDAYIWECACKQLKQWKEHGKDYYISVNISPKDLYFTDVYGVITGLVEKYGIEPSRLKLEITETAIMTNLKKELDLIQKLRDKGFIIEIDDFGSGYSSLNTLKDMMADTIKIDMGFLRKTEHLERSRSILKTIIELSKQLGMEVITEGVETREQVEFLTKFGCDIFQGYYFAKPMPVEDFERKYFSADKRRGITA